MYKGVHSMVNTTERWNLLFHAFEVDNSNFFVGEAGISSQGVDHMASSYLLAIMEWVRGSNMLLNMNKQQQRYQQLSIATYISTVLLVLVSFVIPLILSLGTWSNIVPAIIVVFTFIHGRSDLVVEGKPHQVHCLRCICFLHAVT